MNGVAFYSILSSTPFVVFLQFCFIQCQPINYVSSTMVKVEKLGDRRTARTGAYNYEKNVYLHSSERSRFRVEMSINQTIKGTRMVRRQYETVDDDVEGDCHTDWRQKIDSFDWKKLLDLLRRYIARKNDSETTITSSAWFTTKVTATYPDCTTTPKCTITPLCTTTTTTPVCTTTPPCTTTPVCTTTTDTTTTVVLCVATTTTTTTTTPPPPPPASCIHQHTCTPELRILGKLTHRYTPSHWYTNTPPADYDSS